MPIKWAPSKTTELQGLIYVQQIVNEAKCIFNKVDGTNDIGIDGYIEFTENDSPSGLCVAIQIKSGNSNLVKDKPYVIAKADKDHFELWFNHILPVITVVYIPQESSAYWMDVTQYLNDNEDLIDSGPYTLKISKQNTFNVRSFTLLHRSLLKYQSVYGNDRYFGKALTNLTDQKPVELRYNAIKSLFSFHRNKPETWYYLITHFCFENDFDIQRALLYGFRHLPTHGDIWWHAGNIINDEITKYGCELITKTFKLREVDKLLNHIDDLGISRGSYGYDVNLILGLIPNRIDWLKKIILDPQTYDDKRLWAAICLINEFQYFDLERAINFAISMIDNFPKSNHIEHLSLIKESLIEHSFVDFTG